MRRILLNSAQAAISRHQRKEELRQMWARVARPLCAKFLGSLVFGTIGFAALTGCVVMAQAPGGAGGAGAGQQAPVQRPSTPGVNSPDANNPDTLTKQVDDKKFAKDAAMGGLYEVQLGKVAAEKGGSDGVKKFGRKMVDDHSKANDQLKEILTKESLDVPTSLDSKHQSRLDKISKLSGPAFDKAYIKDQLKDHEKDVSDFQAEAQNGHDPNIKQFATATLPTLQEHLSSAKDLKKEK
jgi:putative membrane protein